MGHFSWRPKNVLFFADTLNRHRRVLRRVKRYQAVKTGEEEQTLRELDYSVLLNHYFVNCTTMVRNYRILTIARGFIRVIGEKWRFSEALVAKKS
jgi:hypothetical protein